MTIHPLTRPTLIMFAEHPMLPYEGHKFLRFSSKISGRQCFAAEYGVVPQKCLKSANDVG
jgi:hypothetical protein